jgi:arsenate reductase
MAEGILKRYYGNYFDVFSAGIEPTQVHPLAVKVMSEIDIDIAHNKSKNIAELINKQFEYVITVCDHAKEVCPFFPNGKKLIHKGFADPSIPGNANVDMVDAFRKSRDSIKQWILSFFEQLIKD